MSHGLRRCLGVTFLLMVSVLAAGCGTFEVHGQLVTPTSTSATSPSDTPATPGIVITDVPAEEAAGGGNDPLDVPRLEAAQIIVDIRTRLIYRSETDLETALAFYESQMPLDGWTQVSATRGETDALFTFSRGDETIMIAITEDWIGLMVEVQSQ